MQDKVDRAGKYAAIQAEQAHAACAKKAETNARLKIQKAHELMANAQRMLDEGRAEMEQASRKETWALLRKRDGYMNVTKTVLTPIDALGLSDRARNSLLRDGIDTIEELRHAVPSTRAKIRNLGPNSRAIIAAYLDIQGRD